MLADMKIDLEPKGIAVGVRLEHPQEVIDRIRYHSLTDAENIFRQRNTRC